MTRTTERERADITIIAEGECPDCGNPVKIISIGGIPDWLYGRQFLQCPFDTRGIEIREWRLTEQEDKFDTIGSVEGNCQGCGKVFCSEQTAGGDWTN